MINLFCNVSLLRRIALRCMDALSSTGFSLCTVRGPQLKPHRLKPVLLDREGFLSRKPGSHWHCLGLIQESIHARTARRKKATISPARPWNLLRNTASIVIAVNIASRPAVAAPIPTPRLGRMDNPP